METAETFLTKLKHKDTSARIGLMKRERYIPSLMVRCVGMRVCGSVCVCVGWGGGGGIGRWTCSLVFRSTFGFVYMYWNVHGSK